MSNKEIKVYIAAPFFNEDQLRIVESIENELYLLRVKYFSPRSKGVLKDMSKEEQKKTKKEIYDSNIDEMNNCTHMIACVEYKDTGTTFEIGYYASSNKPIILFSEKIGTVNVMLAEAALSICDSLGKLPESLLGEYTVEIESLT